ncbi:unnamed protein product [Brassica oleracea var. botrytis]
MFCPINRNQYRQRSPLSFICHMVPATCLLQKKQHSIRYLLSNFPL